MEKIMAIARPIPVGYAERIYKNGKTVFVGKKFPTKASKGDKLLIYESHGAKAYTGWADIKSIEKLKPSAISWKYGKKLMLTSQEFKEYARNSSSMTVIEFENFEKFKKPVKPKRFVSMGGKYVHEQEYLMILKNKD